MKNLKNVEVLRTGDFEDMHKQPASFSLEDLHGIVRSSANKPVPMVIGHPTVDAPAYGWVESLRVVGDRLLADFQNVEDTFYRMLTEKRFTNRSVKIKKVGDAWELCHVGFLGATPPAVDGLAPISFASEPEGIVLELSSYMSSQQILDLFRGLRELLLTQFGAEIADQYLSNDRLNGLQNSIEYEQMMDLLEYQSEVSSSDFAKAPDTEPEVITPPESEPETVPATPPDISEFVSALDRLIKVDGKVLPTERGCLIEVATALAGNSPQLRTFTQSLESRRAIVPMQQVVKPESSDPDPLLAFAFTAAPAGFEIDPEQARLYAAAKKLQSENPSLTLIQAYQKVGGK